MMDDCKRRWKTPLAEDIAAVDRAMDAMTDFQMVSLCNRLCGLEASSDPETKLIGRLALCALSERERRLHEPGFKSRLLEAIGPRKVQNEAMTKLLPSP